MLPHFVPFFDTLRRAYCIYPQYSVIECDVKQAVGLLEMSLSGLVSAESALKRWKGAIPAKVRLYFLLIADLASARFAL